MKKNNSSRFGQKGFYIALSICVVAVFLTAYFVTSNSNTKQNNADQTAQSVVNEPQTPVLPEETAKAISTPTPTPKATEKPVATQPATTKEQDTTTATAASSQPTAFSMPVEGEIVVAHSQEALVYSKTYEDWRIHTGIDINCDKGTSVKAVADGTVEKVYTDPLKGIVIEISHGSIRSVYANLSTDSMVQVGSEVKAGDVISGIGDSGAFESKQQPHLHFELCKDEEPIDPLEWLQA